MSQLYSYKFHTTDDVSFNFVEVYSSGVYTWDSKPMTSVLPGEPSAAFIASNPAARQKIKTFQSKEKDERKATDIYSFNATPYNNLKIWIRMEQIRDGQTPLCNVYPVHAAELEAAFIHYSVGYRCGLISISHAQPALYPLEPFDVLDNNVSGMMNRHG